MKLQVLRPPQKKKPLRGTCIVILPGQYYDEETGLHYNYHRYYDPKIGRYLRADPIGQFGGINSYAFTLNNPVNLKDLKGLESYPEFIYDPSISYYENAKFYEDVPYEWGEIGCGNTDCSGLVCAATGNKEHIWGTPMGAPPGRWDLVTNRNHKTGKVEKWDRETFLNTIVEGNLFVWPGGRHTAFYAGGNSMFHAHGQYGTPVGYTNDLIWYLKNKGYPAVYCEFPTIPCENVDVMANVSADYTILPILLSAP